MENKRPLVRVHNTETDEITDREMNDQEYEGYLLAQKDLEAIKSEIIAKKEARVKLLTKLGITEEEAALLLS